MAIELFLPPSLQYRVDNIRKVDVEGKNAGECLDRLVEKYPQLKGLIFNRRHRLKQGLSIYRNGEKTDLTDLGTPLAEGDKLYLLNVIFGG